MDTSRAWALRCHLELQAHDSAVFSTLTYDPAHVPPSLSKRELALGLKRIRKRAPNRVRFFASGEYGEQTGRPHYHALLYGLRESDAGLIEEAWGKGHVRTEAVTPARIAYVAGYTSKKIGYKLEARAVPEGYGEEVVDKRTGEIWWRWQPPFIQMSRNPGIGADARSFTQSWRLYGVHNGQRMPVPRYLHEAWKNSASPEDMEELELEKHLISLSYQRDKSPQALAAKEAHAVAKQKLRAERRKL